MASLRCNYVSLRFPENILHRISVCICCFTRALSDYFSNRKCAVRIMNFLIIVSFSTTFPKLLHIFHKYICSFEPFKILQFYIITPKAAVEYLSLLLIQPNSLVIIKVFHDHFLSQNLKFTIHENCQCNCQLFIK
jgi:hypothetical protein